MRKKRIKLAVWLGLISLAVALVASGIVLLRSRSSLPAAQLADGRILQIEGLTFGTNHVIGTSSLLAERLGPWLPQRIREFVAPKYPRSEISLKEPALVVWVNALDSKTGQQVDCQMIRVEFIDQHGDLFGEATRYWFGGNKFWRVGHVFPAFPRTDAKLTLQITPSRTNQASVVEFTNPRMTAAAAWSGRSLPQQQRMRGLDILLTELALRTNGGPNRSWETPSRYWEPIWELRKSGERISGWDEVEWTGEDPTGNRGKFLGLHQPVLRFSATFYPSATNLDVTTVMGMSPQTAVANLQSNHWWNIQTGVGSNELFLLGIFPKGTHVFSEGVYQTNPAVSMGPVSGGSSSGWVGSSQRVTPTRVQRWDGHYTPTPVIYLRAPQLSSKDRLAVRLRDEGGRYWPTKPEPQGIRDGISPFLVELPPEVKMAVAEIVLLKPLHATFDVDIASATKR